MLCTLWKSGLLGRRGEAVTPQVEAAKVQVVTPSSKGRPSRRAVTGASAKAGKGPVVSEGDASEGNKDEGDECEDGDSEYAEYSDGLSEVMAHKAAVPFIKAGPFRKEHANALIDVVLCYWKVEGALARCASTAIKIGVRNLMTSGKQLSGWAALSMVDRSVRAGRFWTQARKLHAGTPNSKGGVSISVLTGIQVMMQAQQLDVVTECPIPAPLEQDSYREALLDHSEVSVMVIQKLELTIEEGELGAKARRVLEEALAQLRVAHGHTFEFLAASEPTPKVSSEGKVVAKGKTGFFVKTSAGPVAIAYSGCFSWPWPSWRRFSSLATQLRSSNSAIGCLCSPMRRPLRPVI